METHNIITSRGLPKTNQTTMYLAGDDGHYEAGWWKGLMNVNNKDRFAEETINGDVILFDRATGLCWVQDAVSAGANNGNAATWANAIGFANNLDFAGFTDWRMPNIMELFSLLDFTNTDHSIHTDFINIPVPNSFWSSTTYIIMTTKAYCLATFAPNIEMATKTDSVLILPVRGGV